MVRQDHRRGAEGVGAQDIGAGLQKALIDVGNDVGPGYDQVLIATVVLRSAEVLGLQVQSQDAGASRPIHDHDSLPK